MNHLAVSSCCHLKPDLCNRSTAALKQLSQALPPTRHPSSRSRGPESVADISSPVILCTRKLLPHQALLGRCARRG